MHGSKAQLPQLALLEDEVKSSEVNDLMHDLSVDEVEGTDHDENTGI